LQVAQLTITAETNSTKHIPGISEQHSAAEREYGLRKAVFAQRASDLRSKDRLFVRFRVIAFLLLIGVGCACVADAAVSWLWMLVPIAVFVGVLKLHQPIIKRLRRSEAARNYYTRSLERLAGRWRDGPDCGQQFVDSQHPWSSDLDTFGPGSVFQRLNQCRTLPAQRKLAAWLTTLPATDVIEERQRQAESLRDQLDLREQLAIIDDQVDWATAEKSLTGWLGESPEPFPVWALWGARCVGVVSVVVLIMVFGSSLSITTIFLMMLLQAPFVYANRHRIKSVMDEVDSVDKALQQLSEVTQQFETFPFTEKSLQQLQNRLTVDGVIASNRIRRLSTLIGWLNNALRNQFFMPIAWIFGFYIHLPYRIDRWRTCYGPRVAEWLDAVTTMEVINSVAAFNYEQQRFARPEISEDTIEFTAEQLGHPLLTDAECVRNDVSLTQQTPLMLISGSNMSGKSTLLRSVGTNLVLASCGARVNADRFRAYPFQLGTAMRVSDSLQEGRSLFFSVVQRLKTVVDLTSQDRPVLFLLDEILSGTNSHDRRRGAEAVIRTLVNKSALGMVTTHDLTLTKIVDSMGGKAENKHFEDQVLDGKMTFDYQLRDGVVERSNAIELMQMMGLDV
jgi:hypothetical protein